MALTDKQVMEIYNFLPSVAGEFVKGNENKEDLVQDTMVKVLENREAFKGESDPKTWAYRIMHNHWIDSTRKLERTLEYPVGGMEELANLDDIRVDVYENPANQDITDRYNLEQMLDSLPPQQKRVVELVYLKGYSYKEVGKMLGISPRTVNWHLDDAKKKLRKQYGEEQEESGETQEEPRSEGTQDEQAVQAEGSGEGRA